MPAIKRKVEEMLPDELWMDIFKKSTEDPEFHEMDIDPESFSRILEVQPASGLHLKGALQTRWSTVLVCRRWNRIGTRLLWSHLVIWRGWDGQLIPARTLANLLECTTRFPYVSRISFLIYRFQRTRNNHNTETLDLLKQLPNLHTIRCPILFLSRLVKSKIPRVYAYHTYIYAPVKMPYFQPDESNITCLDLALGTGALTFKHQQNLPQLITLRVTSVSDIEALGPLGPRFITPRLENLCIRGFHDPWDVDSLPRECHGSLRILEVTKDLDTPVNDYSALPDTIYHLPLLRTLRVSAPPPIPLNAMQCPQLHKFHLGPPFEGADAAYPTITSALYAFPSIVDVTIFHDQFSVDATVAGLFSSHTAPTHDKLSFWRSKGVAVRFDPPLLSSMHFQNRLITSAQAFVVEQKAQTPIARERRWSIRYHFVSHPAAESSAPLHWTACYRVGEMSAESQGSWLSKEEAQESAAESMISRLTRLTRLTGEIREKLYGETMHPNAYD